MKKLLALTLVVAIMFTVGCGKKDDDFTTEITPSIRDTRGTGEDNSVYTPTENTSLEQTTATTKASEKQTTTKNYTTNPSPSPMENQNKNLTIVYGKRTGTTKTYTGLEPLKPMEFPVVDPDNIRGISEKTHNHSFGVSKNGVAHSISRENQKLYEKYNGLCLDTSGEKVIYLTFDCGYENGCTQKILDTLKEKNVKAAFFLTLSNVKQNPEIIARMINEGHIVGNHSSTHPNFSKISRTQMVKEIQELDDYLRVHFGYSAPYFRFPEGACSESALDIVNNIGYTSVFWSTAYNDWDVNNPKGADYAYNTVTSRLHPGCVLLLHAISPDNADALERIIDYAHNNGYKFKALSD